MILIGLGFRVEVEAAVALSVVAGKTSRRVAIRKKP